MTEDDRIARLEQLIGQNDTRYREVGVERDKALKIKETADLAALQLARDQQTYKDEQANELREQINSERNRYATKEDLNNTTEKIVGQSKDASARQLAALAVLISLVSLVTFIYSAVKH